MVIKYRLMFKVLYTAASMMHICFLIMFLKSHIMPLVIFNICSVLFYIAGISITFKSRHIDRHIFTLTIMVYIEVTAHAIFATMVVGFETFFLLYGIVILPMCAFTLFCSDKTNRFGIMMVLCVISTILTALTLAYLSDHDCIFNYPLNYEEISNMRMINVIFNMLLVFGFSFLFINHINNLLKQLSETNEQLNYMATHDPLTGLVNRHSLWKFLSVLKQSESHFCICMGDIDNFKRTNDTYGHDCGDKVLKQVAEVIQTGIGGSDMACRWGGEEILIILMCDKEEAYQKVCEMRKQIYELNIEHENQKVATSMTFGFADSEELGDSTEKLESLIALVDKRLYEGKNSGKNKVVSA